MVGRASQHEPPFCTKSNKFLTSPKNGCSATIEMGVSKNRGAPKSSILLWFSIINHPFWGVNTPTFGNTQMENAPNPKCHDPNLLPPKPCSTGLLAPRKRSAVVGLKLLTWWPKKMTPTLEEGHMILMTTDRPMGRKSITFKTKCNLYGKKTPPPAPPTIRTARCVRSRCVVCD